MTGPASPTPEQRRWVYRQNLAGVLRSLVFWIPAAFLFQWLLFHPMWQVSQTVALGGQFTEEELERDFYWSAWKGEYAWALWANRGRLLPLLRNHPRIARADVTFVPPGRLEVRLQEKERYAALVHEGTAFIIASDFTFMALEPAGLVSASRLMTGLSPGILFDRQGRPLRDPFPIWPPQPAADDLDRYYYAKLLQLWRWIDAERDPPPSQVAGLAVTPEQGIILIYRATSGQWHPPILLGYGPELQHKYGQALTVYRSGIWRQDRDLEIDLRFARTVVRTIGREAVQRQTAWLAAGPSPSGSPLATSPAEQASTIVPEPAGYLPGRSGT